MPSQTSIPAPFGTDPTAADATAGSAVDAVIARLASRSTHGSAQEDAVAAAEQLSPMTPAPVPHQPPQMLWTLDGERHEPTVINELDGQALYSTPATDGSGEAVLHSFTGLEGLRTFLSTEAAGDIGTTNPDSLSGVSRKFEQAGFSGDTLSNNPGFAWPDLTQVRRGLLGLGNWNDIITSVDWCRWDTSLYEHVNYGGSQLYLRAGRTYNNISEFGWNDRASATVNWGRRF